MNSTFRLTLGLGLALLTTSDAWAGGCKMMRVPMYPAPMYSAPAPVPYMYPAAFPSFGGGFQMQAQMSGDMSIMLPLLARLGERLFGSGMTDERVRQIIKDVVPAIAAINPEAKLVTDIIGAIFKSDDMKKLMKDEIEKVLDAREKKGKGEETEKPKKASLTPEQKQLREDFQQLAKLMEAGKKTAPQTTATTKKSDEQSDFNRLLAEMKAGQKTEAKPVVVGRK